MPMTSVKNLEIAGDEYERTGNPQLLTAMDQELG